MSILRSQRSVRESPLPYNPKPYNPKPYNPITLNPITLNPITLSPVTLNPKSELRATRWESLRHMPCGSLHLDARLTSLTQGSINLSLQNMKGCS